ncbi:MAG: hypothetical protein HYX76_02045 [Acidobacteria bacterium]|nr:hypothetical protein [Acidobacteriota bacterium]
MAAKRIDVDAGESSRPRERDRRLKAWGGGKQGKERSALPKLDYDVCARCGALFDDQGENGWWYAEGLWWHHCEPSRPARVVVRKLDRVA